MTGTEHVSTLGKWSCRSYSRTHNLSPLSPPSLLSHTDTQTIQCFPQYSISLKFSEKPEYGIVSPGSRREIRMINMHPQEVGGTLIGEDGLVVMTGAESVEWYQMHQTSGFYEFDAIPFAPFRILLWALFHSAASCKFICETISCWEGNRKQCLLGSIPQIGRSIPQIIFEFNSHNWLGSIPQIILEFNSLSLYSI